MTAIERITAPYKGDVPGCAIMVIREGVPIITEVRGFADLEGGIAVSPDTNFRLASVSKHFTAAAILTLRNKGQLTLGDTLERFFPQFPDYGKNITIAQLLTHTSGLPDYENLMDKNNARQIRDAGVLELLVSETRGYFEPSSTFRYSNGGYCLLALIVEQVSGIPLSEYLRREFFVPLGMNNTFANEEGATAIPNRAYGYSRDGDGWTRTDQDTTSATIGDGGIYSSLTDLLLWNNALDSLSLSAQKVLTDEKPSPIFYGFGLFLKEWRGVQVQYHQGSSIGFRSGFYRAPEKKLAVIFLSNRNEGEGTKLCEEIFDTV